MKLFFIFLSMLLINSCSFFEKRQNFEIEIYSDTSASVFRNENGLEKELGLTPYIFKKRLDDQEWVHLTLKKNGYATEHIVLYLPDLTVKQKIKIKMTPMEWWNDPESEASSLIVHKLGTLIQNINRLIRKEEWDQALTLTKALSLQYPKAAILYDIKGSIYILQKQYSLALASYERSLQLSHDNPETRKMVEKLKRDNK